MTNEERARYWFEVHTTQERLNREQGFFDAAVWYQNIACAESSGQLDPDVLYSGSTGDALGLLHGGRRNAQ